MNKPLFIDRVQQKIWEHRGRGKKKIQFLENFTVYWKTQPTL